MVMSKETSPAAYLASLPAERRKVIAAVRSVIKKNLPKGYVESMGYGMLTYQIPLATYPDTYNKLPLMYLALAAQKNNYAIYLAGVTHQKELMEKLHASYEARGKKPDMGKGCLRFKSLEELPLDVIGKLVASTPVEQRIKRAVTARQ